MFIHTNKHPPLARFRILLNPSHPFFSSRRRSKSQGQLLQLRQNWSGPDAKRLRDGGATHCAAVPGLRCFYTPQLNIKIDLQLFIIALQLLIIAWRVLNTASQH